MQHIKDMEDMEDITLNFVDSKFEKSILEILPKKITGKIPIHRNQIIRYGMNKPYDNNIKSKVIPTIFDKFKDIEFDSVTINEYLPSQVIDWHVDKGHNDVFVISLLSDAVMRFRLKKSLEYHDDTKIIEYNLPRFSLFRMHGDMRYKWEHSLQANENRISVVFRKS